MNERAALEVLTYLSLANLASIQTGSARVWADALADLTPEEAMQAARSLTRERGQGTGWVRPADVIERARGSRSPWDRAMNVSAARRQIEGGAR